MIRARFYIFYNFESTAIVSQFYLFPATCKYLSFKLKQFKTPTCCSITITHLLPRQKLINTRYHFPVNSLQKTYTLNESRIFYGSTSTNVHCSAPRPHNSSVPRCKWLRFLSIPYTIHPVPSFPFPRSISPFVSSSFRDIVLVVRKMAIGTRSNFELVHKVALKHGQRRVRGWGTFFFG